MKLEPEEIADGEWDYIPICPYCGIMEMDWRLIWDRYLEDEERIIHECDCGEKYEIIVHRPEIIFTTFRRKQRRNKNEHVNKGQTRNDRHDVVSSIMGKIR